MHLDWDIRFLALFARCTELYRSGETRWEAHFSPEDTAFLQVIGYKPREFFDYVEDHVEYGDPSPSTALLIAATRRDYLRDVQDGVLSAGEIQPEELPAKTAELDGVAWLPRIIAKATAKLRGELNPDIMYGCPGDRGFLQRHQLHPADFLRFVWQADGDASAMLRHFRR